MVNILAIISDSAYQSKIYQIIKDAEKTSNKTVYVSLNKTYRSLVKGFEEDHVNLNKFFFIDTITATLMPAQDNDSCMFVRSPNDVKSLYSGIIKAVKTTNADLLIFDSLSSLTTYKNVEQIIHFVTTLLGSLSLLYCSAVFTCLDTDQDSLLVKHMKMKVDKSYELS